MRDIPLFTTELGVASLMLNQIPYTGRAYVNIRATDHPEAFAMECAGFCVAAGAKEVFASGSPALKKYPHYVDIFLMQADRPEDEPCVMLFPVQEHTLQQWLAIYNKKMEHISLSAHLQTVDGEGLLKEKSAYFVHENGKLLGIGVIKEDTVQTIAACEKGAGEKVLRALCSVMTADTVRVEVASDNLPALRLYERLGFCKCAVVSSWHRIK